MSEVTNVAQLARISLTDEEKVSYEEQFESILGTMDVLSEIDTTNIQPTAQVTGLSNVFREDIVGESLSQANALQNAPDTEKGFIKIALPI